MYKVEVERSNGTTFWFGENTGGSAIEWRYPEDADARAEQIWNRLAGTGEYARFSVIEQDGTIYTDWEC